MTETNRIDIASLHLRVQRETESDALTELEPSFYRDLSEFVGGLKKQEYDGVENKIKAALIDMAEQLTSLLLSTRLEKTRLLDAPAGRLLDEEKFILDSQEEQQERTEMIISATINGKSKFLESIAHGHKTKRVTVRILQDADELMGADMQRYGPFKAEDIATIPYDNAQALITKGAATRVRLED
ncbi:MAG: hypothetical protein D9C04_03005 [Nitrosopumilus sp. B06]|nr:MAG: hypothetical protein EB828_02460 [Nitrosopumilus sp. D6]RNJ80099.1 MAG: hypothetical protein D9C04_03005 [Nitrosopumilus sp. B06]